MNKPNKNRNFILTAMCIFAILIILIIIISAVIKNGGKTETVYNGGIVSDTTGEIETTIHTSEDISENSSEPQPETTSESPVSPPTSVRIPVKVKKAYQDKFDLLREKYNNDDIIGIIKIPDSVVYYPVAYYPENTEYYLNRNLYKNLSAAGSICLDYENSVERHDPNTILYGHQMSSNSMFHTLSYYTDEEFFNSHRYIIFNTIYEDNVWEVFAFFKTNISFNYIKVFFRSERDFLNLAAEMKERSMYDTGIEIGEGDRILTLSTCTNQEQDTRYVLVAKMVKNKADIPEEIALQMANAVEDFK